jgi:hypothetical protein
MMMVALVHSEINSSYKFVYQKNKLVSEGGRESLRRQKVALDE